MVPRAIGSALRGRRRRGGSCRAGARTRERSPPGGRPFTGAARGRQEAQKPLRIVRATIDIVPMMDSAVLLNSAMTTPGMRLAGLRRTSHR
ncbi:hypothetical protein GCM10027174_28890 [Salinifilum aidingensis]